MQRTDMGVKGKDRNGNQFGIMWDQVSDIEKTAYGCRVRLDTGEAIPLGMGYERAKAFFAKPD